MTDQKAGAGADVWLITGCSTGLGQAMAERTLERGHRVVATARNPDDLADLRRRYSAEQLLVTRLDVEDAQSVTDAVALTLETFGALDVLVNNAGVGMIGCVEETTPQEVSRIFGVNVMGTLGVIRAVLPHMRAKKRGRIVVISSAGAIMPGANIGIYFGSKAALEGMMEAMRGEIAHLGISCHLVEPGLTRTGMRSRGMPPPAQPIADYDFVRVPRLAALEQPYPEGTTTPEQVCDAILDLMAQPEPAFRLPVGKDTATRIQLKIDELKSALEVAAAMGATT